MRIQAPQADAPADIDTPCSGGIRVLSYRYSRTSLHGWLQRNARFPQRLLSRSNPGCWCLAPFPSEISGEGVLPRDARTFWGM